MSTHVPLLAWFALVLSSCVSPEVPCGAAPALAPDGGQARLSPGLGAAGACLQTLDEQVAIAVTPSGRDTAACGTAAAPCQSPTHAVERAVASGRRAVLLAAGTYGIGEQPLRLKAGVSLVGGFSAQSWTRPCPGDPSLVTIEPVGELPPVVALDLGGDAELDTLTVLGTPRAALDGRRRGQAGGSSVGVLVRGASSRVVLRNVRVIADDAGDGAPGQAGDDGAGGDPLGPCAATLTPEGVAGAAGPAGAAQAARFTAEGFRPGDGRDGAEGASGGPGRGLRGAQAECLGCGDALLPCDTPSRIAVITADGVGGCGGYAGRGGTGGRGGGSSVALLVVDAKVELLGGQLLAGRGGRGGDGGQGGQGGWPSSGRPGPDAPCPTSCAARASTLGGRTVSACRAATTTQVPGGEVVPGGRGGAGGAGAGGAGGSSHAVVLIGGATLDRTGTPLLHGEPGEGGAGGQPGPRGAAGPVLEP